MDLERARALLLEVEDPERWESPRDFSLIDAHQRLKALRDAVNARFASSCRVILHDQDAAYHGSLIFAGEMIVAPEAGEPHAPGSEAPVGGQMRASNFGHLAVLIHEHRLKPQVRPIVRQMIEGAGYVLVPHEVLLKPYSGGLRDSQGRLVREKNDPTCTWFWRLFDFL